MRTFGPGPAHDVHRRVGKGLLRRQRQQRRAPVPRELAAGVVEREAGVVAEIGAEQHAVLGVLARARAPFARHVAVGLQRRCRRRPPAPPLLRRERRRRRPRSRRSPPPPVEPVRSCVLPILQAGRARLYVATGGSPPRPGPPMTRRPRRYYERRRRPLPQSLRPKAQGLVFFGRPRRTPAVRRRAWPLPAPAGAAARSPLARSAASAASSARSALSEFCTAPFPSWHS